MEPFYYGFNRTHRLSAVQTRADRQELHTLYCPTDEERDFIAAHARGATQQLTLLTLLKCHQHLGYLPALADVPAQIRTYLCQQLSLFPLMYDSVEADKTLYRYRQLIRTYLQITPYGEGGQAVVTTAVQHAAHSMSDPADLINLADGAPGAATL